MRALSVSNNNTQSKEESLRNNVVRINIYKTDKLYPELVFVPQSYLFEMNRFPTRIISNWDFDAFANDTVNILQIPTKYFNSDKQFEKHADYTKAFQGYGDFLTEKERFEVYTNHVKSFLAEEYIRWFTDSNIDETRFHNYGGMFRGIINIEAQYNNYMNSVKNAASVNSQTTSPVTSTYKDYLTGKTYQMPIKSIFSNLSPRTTAANTKSMTIDLTDTVRSYFTHDTFMNLLDGHQKRVAYPKKFDRVFNVIFDPDDFLIDAAHLKQETLDSLLVSGIIKMSSSPLTVNNNIVKNARGQKNTKYYQHRDTTPDDVTFDEYFVTVSPFDYV
jgi:hypothetical protein